MNVSQAISVIEPERLALSVPEVGRALGLSRAGAFAAVRRGDIPALRIGKRLVVPRRVLDELLAGPLDARCEAWRRLGQKNAAATPAKDAAAQPPKEMEGMPAESTATAAWATRHDVLDRLGSQLRQVADKAMEIVVLAANEDWPATAATAKALVRTTDGILAELEKRR